MWTHCLKTVSGGLVTPVVVVLTVFGLNFASVCNIAICSDFVFARDEIDATQVAALTADMEPRPCLALARKR